MNSLETEHFIGVDVGLAKWGDVSALRRQSPKEYLVALHVDMSASVQGFLADPNGKFRKVLEKLSARRSQIDLRAIGTPSYKNPNAPSHPTLVQLLDIRNYDR